MIMSILMVVVGIHLGGHIVWMILPVRVRMIVRVVVVAVMIVVVAVVVLVQVTMIIVIGRGMIGVRVLVVERVVGSVILIIRGIIWMKGGEVIVVVLVMAGLIEEEGSHNEILDSSSSHRPCHRSLIMTIVMITEASNNSSTTCPIPEEEGNESIHHQGELMVHLQLIPMASCTLPTTATTIIAYPRNNLVVDSEKIQIPNDLRLLSRIIIPPMSNKQH
mmetsp:Transcript_26950/g.53837  ORF Transcript_26950/g.53837 Transcript_26950/m.53837 type:complete len:219 (-) Transcript_26950:2052-2708(-)